MRHPPAKPQRFHEAVRDFVDALDVSIDRIAPFAGLHPQQLYRLGQDGKHHTLKQIAIDQLIMASVLVGRPIAPEKKDAWEKYLKISSLYTTWIVAANRRSNSQWPQTVKDYAYLWEVATDMVLYSKYKWFYIQGDAYQHLEKRGFHDDAVYLFERWSQNQLETEDDILSALNELDKIQ